MHDHCQLARQGPDRSIEAKPFFELQRPGSQGAGIRRPVQDDRGRLVLKSAQLIVATARDMSVIIDLAELVTSRGQAYPCAHGARVSEVRRILDGCGKGGGCYGAYTGH